ncbi:MAG TPA: aminotransferase class V-fold PLP-dependent enzyme [Planctomycetota bacterium]|jgi:O-acetylhomoserine (thiol)-lyase
MGIDDLPQTAAATPIDQAASYAYGSAQELADVFAGKAPGHIYTRISGPTTLVLERRLAELEDSIGCIATSSGMAAITAVMMGLLRSGDEIVSAAGIFGGTISLFKNVLGRFGVKTTLVSAGDTEQFRQAITPATRVIFVETIGNPGMDVPDLSAIAELARAHRILFVVDSTLTSPALIRPKEFGADIVVHSTTKYINGHGTVIGGALIDTGRYDWSTGPFADVAALAKRAGRLAFLSHLRMLIYRDLGGCAAPGSSWLMLQGLETLTSRMRAHCDNALKIAELLRQHRSVGRVDYPGLQCSTYYPRVSKFFGGRGGGLLTLRLGSRERAFRFIDSLKTVRIATNLGETRTLVIHPASTIFHEYSADQRAELGVPDDLVRMALGIDEFDKLKQDVLQALDQVEKEKA